MVFTCSLCTLLDPGSGRRERGQLRLTDANQQAIKVILVEERGDSSASRVDDLSAGQLLCLRCFPESLRCRVDTRKYGKLTPCATLVGAPVAEWFVAGGGQMRRGVVVAVESGVVSVDWEEGDGIVQRREHSASAASTMADLGRWVAARDPAPLRVSPLVEWPSGQDAAGSVLAVAEAEFAATAAAVTTVAANPTALTVGQPVHGEISCGDATLDIVPEEEADELYLLHAAERAATATVGALEAAARAARAAASAAAAAKECSRLAARADERRRRAAASAAAATRYTRSAQLRFVRRSLRLPVGSPGDAVRAALKRCQLASRGAFDGDVAQLFERCSAAVDARRPTVVGVAGVAGVA